jgi:hypothetical protein
LEVVHGGQLLRRHATQRRQRRPQLELGRVCAGAPRQERVGRSIDPALGARSAISPDAAYCSMMFAMSLSQLEPVMPDSPKTLTKSF